MTLKADRDIESYEVGYFINETADPGVVLSVSTAGSGIALDSSDNVATVQANSSGALPLGVNLNEVVNLDQTRQPVNWHKDQINQGNKVAIARKDWVVTDKTVSATAGKFAVLASSGQVMDQPAIGTWNQVANPRVGRFMTTRDEDGFARLYVDL